MFVAALVAQALTMSEHVRFQTRRDAITDQVIAMAVVRSGEDLLAIGCNPAVYDGLNIVINTQYSFPTGRYREQFFTHRFDSQAPVRIEWDTYYRHAQLRRPRDVEAFLQSFVSSRRGGIRVPSLSGGERDLVFPILSPHGPIRLMLEACGKADWAAALVPADLIP